MRVRLWCVGICFSSGEHRYRVFDDADEARNYRSLQLNVPGRKVYFWELTE